MLNLLKNLFLYKHFKLRMKRILKNNKVDKFIELIDHYKKTICVYKIFSLWILNDTMYDRDKYFINYSKISVKQNTRYYANAYNENKLIKFYNGRQNSIKSLKNKLTIKKEKTNLEEITLMSLWASYNNYHAEIKNLHIFYLDKPRVMYFKTLLKVADYFIYDEFIGMEKYIYVVKTKQIFVFKKQRSIKKNLKKKQIKQKNNYLYCQI